jgi:hypothetical protein
MQPAVLLELLCHLPMRVKNAASLDLKKHFQRTVGGKSGNWRVHIPKGEVKNDKAIDAELGITTSERISRYETVFRPALCDGQSTALFVSKKGQQKGPSAYGLYLGRLREQGHLDPDMRPVDRVDAPGVGAFVKEYSVGRAPHTVALAVRGNRLRNPRDPSTGWPAVVDEDRTLDGEPCEACEIEGSPHGDDRRAA